MPPTDKPTCAGKIWSRFSYTRCYKAGIAEHAGEMWCKTHHPPTVEARDKARQARNAARWAQQQRAWLDKRLNEDLKIRALEWMRRENSDVVREWEAELNAKK